MENEIKNYDEVMETEEETVAEGKTGIGTGGAMLIGGVLTLAGVAIVNKAKKVIANHKAKKAAKAEESEEETSEEK